MRRAKKKARVCGPSLDFFCSPTWARTRDLRINSPALYQLSYRGTACDCSVGLVAFRPRCPRLSKPSVEHRRLDAQHLVQLRAGGRVLQVDLALLGEDDGRSAEGGQSALVE